MIHECQILCYNASEVEKGLKEENFWVPFLFDMRDVVSIKAYCNDKNDVETDKSVLYFSGGIVIVDLPLTIMMKSFRDSRMLSFPIATISQQ